MGRFAHCGDAAGYQFEQQYGEHWGLGRMMAGFGRGSRRADEFATVADGQPSSDAELTALLVTVDALRAVDEPVARPAFVADLRSRLVAAAAETEVHVVDDTVVTHLTPSTHGSGNRERRLATVLGAVAALSATTSMAVAAQGAGPGDVLYPVKRAIEHAEARVQSSDESRATTLLDHADERLTEVKDLQAEGASAERLNTALTSLTEQTKAAAAIAMSNYQDESNTAGLSALRAFAGAGADDLLALSPSVPADARSAVVTATQTLRKIDAAAWQACPTCGGTDAELPDLALVSSISSLLDGDAHSMTDLATTAEGVAAAAHKPHAKEHSGKSPAPGTKRGNTATPSTPDPAKSTVPVPSAPNVVENTRKRVHDGVSGATDGDPRTSSGSPVIDGLTGLLGTLTDPLDPTR